MSDIINATVFGTIQGLTEFLPVSSSGHLVWAQELFGLGGEFASHEQQMAAEVLVHLGSLLAIFFVFRKDILSLFWPRISWSKCFLLLWVSAPVAVFVFGLKALHRWDDFQGGVLTSPLAASIGWLFTAGILMIASQVPADDERPAAERVEWNAISARDWLLAGLVGAAQVVALAPGISRSGTTIAAALVMGWVRSDALRLSFLMGAIAIGGAGILEAKHVSELPAGPAAAMFISSLVFSLVGLLGVRLVVRRGRLGWFALYTALLGVAGIVWLSVR
jgi:undecaprenyl-diphosphatase